MNTTDILVAGRSWQIYHNGDWSGDVVFSAPVCVWSSVGDLEDRPESIVRLDASFFSEIVTCMLVSRVRNLLDAAEYEEAAKVTQALTIIHGLTIKSYK